MIFVSWNKIWFAEFDKYLQQQMTMLVISTETKTNYIIMTPTRYHLLNVWYI